MKNIYLKESKVKHEHGLIVGRFQPFHLEHLRYTIAAAKKVNHLWIGITRPLGNLMPEIGGLRAHDSSNPLPYWLRLKCVDTALLKDAGIPRSKFSIIPVSLNREIAKDVVPQGAIFLTTIVEQWNIDREKLFINAGFKVLRLDLGGKKISGSMIRDKIKQKDGTWKNYIPQSIRVKYASLIAAYVLNER